MGIGKYVVLERAERGERNNGEVSEAKQGGDQPPGPLRRSQGRHRARRRRGHPRSSRRHCLVAGIKKYPSKVIRKDSAKKTAKKYRVKAFIKLVNYQHQMPTRYTLDVDLKDVVNVESLQTKDKKVTALKEVKKRFEERFKTRKNRWFFTKLKF
ncbi:hypothetical protein C1H46_037823 [Malus baccata]|uniref:60S ribosomal protein L27 n=1 Tax=Malus baccata TaxID=106549 RepID=A0A540KQX5_MALBA|nr:hypothetical protein C1H46_037823 [Malus baccata]